MNGDEVNRRLVRVERVNDLVDLISVLGITEVTDMLKQRKENNNMENTATNSQGTTFKTGDRVRTEATKSKGVIEGVYALIRYESSGLVYTSVSGYVDIDKLTHYEGPTDEADAWERVTMDIGAEVYRITQSHWQTALVEDDRRSLRHNAYVVLGSVLKVDEDVKARVRGIIERAEKRYRTSGQ